MNHYLKMMSAVGLTALIGTSAIAQIASGYSGQPGWREADASEYWWSVEVLGHCLNKSKPTLSVALLRSERGSDSERSANQSLVGRHTACLKHLSRMGLGTIELRGTIAEAAYKNLAKIALAKRKFTVAQVTRAELVKLGADRLTTRMADCVASLYPGDLHQLFSTTWGSKAEATVLSSLNDEVASCSPGKVRFEMPASELRSALAQAAYRRAVGMREAAK